MTSQTKVWFQVSSIILGYAASDQDEFLNVCQVAQRCDLSQERISHATNTVCRDLWSDKFNQLPLVLLTTQTSSLEILKHYIWASDAVLHNPQFNLFWLATRDCNVPLLTILHDEYKMTVEWTREEMKKSILGRGPMRCERLMHFCREDFMVDENSWVDFARQETKWNQPMGECLFYTFGVKPDFYWYLFVATQDVVETQWTLALFFVALGFLLHWELQRQS